MNKSYTKINYSIRPAKSIERKMFCEAFRKLSEFGKVEKYRYIGFGSTYFSDFYLFHKSLGIKHMISIEKYEDDKDRFKFNIPFSCIDVKFGPSNRILPNLKWDVRTILWLDYDQTLDAYMLSDINHFFTSAITGSVIIMTIDASVRDTSGEVVEDGKRMQILEERIGKDKIPRDIKEKDLHGWETAKIYHKIIVNEIEDLLHSRNGAQSEGNKLLAKQLFHFWYADGAKMLTVGFVLFDQGSETTFDRCGFNQLEFVKTGEEPYEIEVPKLTLREIKHLDKFLPSNICKSYNFIPDNDKNKYSKVYRYFPLFAETEL